MGKVTLEIGESRWPVNCRDGEEAQVMRLGAMLNDRWEMAQRAAGDAGAARVMLLIALMLADELVDAKERAAPNPDGQALDGIADHLERLAWALEHELPSD